MAILLIGMAADAKEKAFPKGRAQVAIHRVSRVQAMLDLSDAQMAEFKTTYQDYKKKRRSAVRRATLKARSARERQRSIKKALKKADRQFDDNIQAILSEDQFSNYVREREQVMGRLTRRRGGFSNSGIPNPGGINADSDIGGGVGGEGD